MSLTPVEIRHIRLKRALFGYGRSATSAVLDEIADSFEDVWRERADLADKVEQLESDLVRYRELEALLRTTLVSAEKASSEMKEQARREADIVLNEAHAEARAVVRRAAVERELLRGEARRIRTLLRSALASLGPEGELDGDDEEEDSPEVEAA
jgi:cell division initiation protein